MATRPRVKARTGCLTCRARKVKCDEFKPSCRRCTTSGRTCGGYANNSNTSDALVISKRRSPTAEFSPGPELDNRLSNALDGIELQWLHRFSSHTGPALSGDPENKSFWSIELPQLSFSEPAIRHALLAVSSCHAHFETQPGDPKQCGDIVCRDFTIKHYSLAIATLRQLLDLESTKLHVPLVCCLLFICLECLYGNTSLILAHLQNGLNILDSPSLHETNSHALESITRKLKPIFNAFKAQSTVFGMSAFIPTQTPLLMDFIDVPGAKAKLDVLINACMSFVKHQRIAYGDPQRPVGDSKRLQQKNLLDKLLAWETRMHSLNRDESSSVDSNDASVMMLEIRQQATFVYVAVCLDPQQTFCDSYLPRFEAIISLIERFMADTNNNKTSAAKSSALCSTFSLESSLLPALWLTVLRCRDPGVRRRTISLLEKHPGREGLWDAKLYAKAARRVVEIEEASMAVQFRDTSQWPDERLRVHRADVHRVSEEPARSARLVFYTAPNGYFGNKLIWNEDISF